MTENQLTCRHSVLQPGDNDSKSVTAAFINDGATYPLVVSELEHPGFTDTQQVDNQATLSLDNPQLGLSSVTFADTGNGPTSLPAAGSQTLATDYSGQSTSDEQGVPVSSGGSAGAGSTGPFSLALMALFGLSAGLRRWQPSGRATR